MPAEGYFDRKFQECLDLAEADEDLLARAVYLAMAEEFRDKADAHRAIVASLAAAATAAATAYAGHAPHLADRPLVLTH